MRRALGTVGFSYLITQLLAAFLPPAAFGPLAAIFVALAVAVLLFWKGKRLWVHTAVILFTAAAAIALRAGYLYAAVAPVQALCGQTAGIQATVLSVRPGYGEDTVYATVRVECVDGTTLRTAFHTEIEALPLAAPGERVAARVCFEPLAANEYRAGSYAKRIYVRAVYEAAFSPQGQSRTPAAVCARWQAALSSRVRSLLPGKYGAVAAAMAMGDRTYLSAEYKEPFRRAGLSHILVVSGLHLSMVSGMVYMGLRPLCKRRIAAFAACCAACGFMCLVGFTPSVTRAGVAMLCFYAGLLFRRQSDALTSLGLAALLLCLANPCAASDIGLLLSFSATLGVLWAGEIIRGRKTARGPEILPQRLWHALCGAALIALAATAATLPALISIGGGVSVLSVACNLLCVGPAGAVVFSGLCAGVLSFLPPLGFLAKLAGLVCGLLLRWLFWVTDTAAAFPGAFIHITGTYAVGVALALCALGFGAWRLHIRPRRAAAACMAFVLLAGGLYAAADAGVVHYAMAGTGVNPPLVVTQGLRTVVLYRGPETNADRVCDYLEQCNRTQIDLLVDLRPEGDTATLAQKLWAKESLCAQSLTNNAVLEPFQGIIIYVKHQAEGNFACVETGGRRVGVAAGRVDVSVYPAFDVYFGGSGTPGGLRCGLLVLPAAGRYDWAETMEAQLYRGPVTPRIAVRSGGAIKIKEVTNDFE